MKYVKPALVGLALSLAACGGPSKPVAATATVTAPAPSPSPFTPQVCIDALDKAEEVILHAKTGISYSADIADAASDGFMAAASFDVDGLTKANDKVTEATQKIQDLTPIMSEASNAYNDAADKCRRSAK